MKKAIIISFAALCFACASETEQKSLDRIADIYDGKTSYSKSFNSSTGKETIRSFKAKISESKLIDSLNPNVTSANIAVLVYDGFAEEEQDKYTGVDVEMINMAKDTASYTYPIDVVKKVHGKSLIFKSFSESLIDGDAKTIDEMRSLESIPEAVGGKVLNSITNLKNKYGSLIGYDPFGIAEISDAQGTAYQFQSYLIFSSGKKVPYIVIVDTNPEKNKIEGFRIFE